MLQNYRQIMGTLSFWLLLCLVASLPYSHAIIRPLWVAWLVSWALQLHWLQKPVFSKQYLLNLTPVIALGLWFIWEFVSVAWSVNADATWRILGRHINLLAVLVICIFGIGNSCKASAVLRTLIFSSVLSVGVYLMLHFWVDNAAAALSDELQPDKSIDWLRMEELTYWMKHRMYYAMMLTVSLVGVFFLLPEHIRTHGRWQAITLSIAASLVLLAGIWWSGSRMNMVNVLAIAGIWAVWHTPGYKKLFTGSALLLLAAGILWSVVSFYPRIAGSRTYLSDDNLSAAEVFAFHPEEEEPSFEPRIAIWHAAVESPSDYLVHGIGAGASKGYMTEKYQAHGWSRLANRAYSPHNQYLTECIELGAAVAVLFLLLWLLLPFCYRGRTREFALYISAILLLSMLTESFFDRIEGVLIVCVLLLLLNQLSREEA